ncbi:hypothetical protein NFI96_007734 [Prochilodus magdalenae]|nr:hypothetical protein NFI96_007734 [Prochilodus magdalenae]
MILFSLRNSSILWLVTCISSISADSQNFILAKVGSSVVLPCHWKNVSTLSPHVEWRTFTETVFERKGEEQYQGEGYQDRVDVPKEKLKDGDCSLVLQNIRPADEGVYESYLLVKRGKRSLSSKRVFLQSVELWVDVTERLQTARSAKPSSVLILLDLSAAFDTENHKILLSALTDLGITGTAWKWFESYLEDRHYQTGAPSSVLTVSDWCSILCTDYVRLVLHPLY